MLRLLALLTAALFVAHAAAYVPSDAGSGADAPGTREAALLVPDGTHLGRADNPKDVDWYRAPVDDLRCVTVHASGTTRSDVTLEVEGRPLTSRLPEWPPASLHAAARATPEVLIGLAPGYNPAGGSPSRPGVYVFELERRAHAGLGPGDAGTGKDAGDTRAAAVTVGYGCIGGSLESAADLADAYRLQGEAGRWVGLSLAHLGSKTLFLTLLAPSGQRVAQVAGAGTVAVELPVTGAYTLAVTPTNDTGVVLAAGTVPVSGGLTQPTAYVVAVTEDPGRGCRPFCNTG